MLICFLILLFNDDINIYLDKVIIASINGEMFLYLEKER